MRKFCTVLIAGATLAVGAGSAQSQGLHAVRSLPGYVCMGLNLTEQQMMTERVAMLDKPEASGRPIGYLGSIVIASVSSPVNGYQRVLRLDGLPGWLSASLLKPWKSPSGDDSKKCVPILMSNGRFGVDVE
jgi:hypothetical protein